MTVRRSAAIDCGTNSIRLLIADVDADRGTAVDVVREMTVVRLGEGVDATGAFSASALERTFAACRTYAELLRDAGSPPMRFVATSASRDVSNRTEFIDGVHTILGVRPEVISGQEEGALSFAGATAGIPPGAASPFLVVDIGGGSTEFVVGTDRPSAAMSVDMGCVRLTERFLRDDPPGTVAITCSMPTSLALPAIAPVMAPIAKPSQGARKTRPISMPQKAPPRPAPTQGRAVRTRDGGAGAASAGPSSARTKGDKEISKVSP